MSEKLERFEKCIQLLDDQNAGIALRRRHAMVKYVQGIMDRYELACDLLTDIADGLDPDRYPNAVGRIRAFLDEGK